MNHNGGQKEPGYFAVHSKLRNRRLYKNLQKDYHLFLIDWSEKWIKMYINGILTAKFKNEINIPMQIVMSRTNMSKTIVQK
jgi:hypothetical protein